jgi:hypothetical protein
MSSRQPYFRYSLRSLLLLVAVAAVACLWYRSHRAFVQSPLKVDAGGGYRPRSDPQYLRTRIYRDHEDRLVAVLLLAFDELDAHGPRFELKRGYNSQEGGWVVLDGRAIEPLSRPRVFASGPAGRVVELDLTAAQARDLAGRQTAAQIEAVYRNVIEPKFFRIEGRSDAKGRQGLWTYRLAGGELFKEVSYSEGLRHGSMKTYYPSGSLKSEGHFQHGAPAGEWKLFAEGGGLVAIIDRNAAGSDVRKSAKHARRWESQMDDQHGYRLFVDGAELKMPE